MVNISINFKQLDLFNAPESDLTSSDYTDPEIETLYELIAENVFDFDIPESDDESIDNDSISFHLYFYSPTVITFCAPRIRADHYSYNYTGSSVIQNAPVSPPPKFC